MQPLSLLAYSKHRGCSCEAVRKAIQSGRLEDSVVMVRGKPKIRDAELADAEWEANTRAKRPRDSPSTGDDSDISYAEARRRKEIELWRQAQIKSELDRLELCVKRGELVAVADVRAEVIDKFAVVRTKLLGLPTRCRQHIGTLTAPDVGVIDDLVREVLEELADGK